MIICNKCNELKEDSNYSTYYHSTQKKQRTRKICKSCFNKQKVEYRLRKKINTQMIEEPVEPITIPPVEDTAPTQDYIECLGCKELKSPDDYYESKRGRYPGKKLTRCKECHQKYYSTKARRLIELNGEKVKPVPNKPNTYADDYQKVNTFEMMIAMGWTFDEDKKVWWKDGVKSVDKEWAYKQLPSYIPPIYKRTRQKGVLRHYAFDYIPEIKQLLKQGYTYLYVCRQFNMSKPTLSKLLKLDGKEENNS
jgi:hypothetical protein